MFEREELLIGKDKLNKLKKMSIAVVGIGGVGGFALESLVRSGVGVISIFDYDTFEESNLNRQIISDIPSINKNKVDVANIRYTNINKELKLNIYNEFISKDNIKLLSNHDYIIDACDSIRTKIEIIKFANENNIKLISCMGMGNRIDSSLVYQTKLSKTENDPLAKKIRYELRKENIDLNIDVIASKELPIKSDIVTSMIMVPAVAGIYLANYVINDYLL